MYTNTHLVFGFHGCDISIAEKILKSDTEELAKSDNPYDWLGTGIYFWENDPVRALEYAKELQGKSYVKSKISTPAVVGAIIDLKNCLNLLNRKYLKLLEESYIRLKILHENANLNMPENDEKLSRRFLDRAVIELIHSKTHDLDNTDFDTVRSVFWEGNDLYPNAGFKSKNHIQICVRNHNCIKGYFRPRGL